MAMVTDHNTTGPVATSGRAAAVIDELRRHEKTVGADQARRAQLMVTFADIRRRLDQQRISEREAAGGDAQYQAGEFAVIELSLAVAGSKHHIQRTTAMARRLQAEAPDVWDCWSVGDIDQDKAIRINRALRRLVRDESKKLLNQLVVKIAPLKTPELLGRWLNQFIAQIEPDETDERLRRSFEDRYVSIRPDIDGISFLHAALSCVDAAAIDQLLSALAAAADPDDSRTHAQRRADALVDILCGRVSNGCHVRWDTNTDTDDHLDDAPDPDQSDDRSDSTGSGGEQPADPPHSSESHTPPAVDSCSGNREPGQDHQDTNPDNTNPDNTNRPSNLDNHDPAAPRSTAADNNPNSCQGGHGDQDPASGHVPTAPEDSAGDQGDAADWPESDWDQPVTTFRTEPPEPSGSDPATDHDTTADQDTTADPHPAGGNQPAHTPPGTWVITPCPGNHQTNPMPVHIGIVITAASLFGHTNTPGQLQDRSSLVAADHVRRLAAQPGTLFHRLITDDAGNLLQVTELGRFPSRKLGIAIDYRDGTCTNPTCHTPAHRCDHDHVIPHPEGATTGINLNNDCRPEHRAKTHGGHHTSRPTPHTTTWTTPTGHTYQATDPPLPVEPLPIETLPDEPRSEEFLPDEPRSEEFLPDETPDP